MSRANTVHGDQSVTGTITCGGFKPPAGCITNAAVEAAAGIDATKLEHSHLSRYVQANGSAVTAARVPLHVVEGTVGEIQSFKVGLITACIGDSTITVTLKKNGSNILSSAIVLDSGNSAYVVEADAGFTSVALVAGDFLDVTVAVSAGSGTLGQGLLCQLRTHEGA